MSTTRRRSVLLCLVVACAVLLGACRSSADRTKTDRIAQVEQGLRPAVVAAGESVPTLPLDARRARWNVPGVSVAVLDDGELAWARGYGVKAAGTSDSVTAQTLFQAASISKPVTAVAALRLAADRGLQLDAPANRYLQSWTVPQNEYTRDSSVTMRRLLSHTAGTTVPSFPGYAEDEPVPSLGHVLDGQSPANTPPIRVSTAPGSTMRYSGGGYTVLQQLMIDVAGESFPELMDRLVLTPLRMEQSTFQQPLPSTRTPEVAVAHTDSGAVVNGKWRTYPEMAAAGLWTTAPDLAWFARALHEAYQGRSDFLAAGTARRMMTPVRNEYGLGVTIRGRDDSLQVGHSGSNRGYRGRLIVYPATGDGAVVLTNGYGGGVLASEILRAVAEAYGWPGARWNPKEKESITVGRDTLARYVGVYRSASGREVTVQRAGDGLRASMPVIGNDLTLVPMSPRRFFVTEIDAEVEFDASGGSGKQAVDVFIGGDRRWMTATRVQ